MQDLIDNLIKKGNNKEKSIRRSKRELKKFIEIGKKIGMYIYFATFTFKEEYTSLNIKDFPKRNFIRYLKKYDICCMLHADFGKKYGRFHLHGVVLSFYELPKDKIFDKYGFVSLKPFNEKAINYIVKYSIKFNFDMFRVIKINNFKKILDKYIK